MHRVTLAFDDDEVEQSYLRSRTRRWTPWAIGAALYAFGLQPIAFLVGLRLLPHERALLIYCVLSATIGLALAVGIARAVPARFRSNAVGIAAPIGSIVTMASPLALASVGSLRAVALSLPGLAITIGVFYTGVGLRFVSGLVVTWALVAAYLVSLMALGHAARPTIELAALWLAAAQLFSMQQGYAEERSRRRLYLQQRMLDEERARSDRLLYNMLPGPIAERLKRHPGAIADGFERVTVLFADIVGFTPLSEKMSPPEVVALLNEVFSTFDALAGRHGLEKIKTIGDAYMVVGGLPRPQGDHAALVARMALDMQAAAAGIPGIQLRIGVHTGVAGVIGTAKYSYDLWGDTVNTASRMESHGLAGRVHISDASREALGAAWKIEERGVIEVKGKGPMKTYWLVGPA
jgi:class 3 adenylate cyclase